MTVETIDFIEKYRGMNLNIGELKPNSKQPQTINGKIPWHNEINENVLNLKDGLCVFCGKTSLNLMILDLDTKTLFEFFKMYDTFIVKSGRGYHLYFRTYENPKSRGLTNSKGEHIDILGQGKIAVLPPSIHKDTKKPYEIISDKKIKQLTTQEERGLYQKLKDLGFSLDDKLTAKKGEFEKTNAQKINESINAGTYQKKTEGQNRQGDLLSHLTSLKTKSPELGFDELKSLANIFQNKHFEESYDEKRVEEIVNDSMNYGEKNIVSNAVEKSGRLEELLNNGVGELTDDFAIIELTKLLILEKRIVSILDLRQEIKQWVRKWKIKSPDMYKIIDNTINSPKIFTEVKKICYDLGLEREEIVFDRSQLTEVSQFLKGRYHVKRIELNGNLIIFNGNFYEQEAEALLRRVARQSILKSKSNDMNEIIKQVEDTCKLITTKDIEKYVHLKCFLNGIYDTKRGEFETEFNPDYIILNQIPYNYVTDGRYDTIQKRIASIMPDKKDQQTYKDFLSTCLMPYSGIDFQLGLVGIAGTGKGRLAKLVKIIFGEKNMSHVSTQRLSSDPTLQIECAYGFVNVDEEMKDTDVTHIENEKKWITQDDFTDRGIYGHKISFRPTARKMFCTNNIYEIPSPDDALAMYERTHLIRCDQKFRGTDREIKDLWGDIDESEFAVFISHLVRNSTKVFENKGIQYPQDTEHTERLWNQYGNHIRNFIDEWLVKSPLSKLEGNSVWVAFHTDQLYKGFDSKGRGHFYKKFDEILGQTSTKIRDGDSEYYGYLGYELKTIQEKDEQERIDSTPKGKLVKLIKKLSEDDKRIESLNDILK